MILRRQMGIAVPAALLALAVLLTTGTAPVLDASPDRPRVPFAVVVGRTEGLTTTHYAAWVDANDRFATAARQFGNALGGCRMRLGSFHACARAAFASMAYEGHNAAGMAATFERQPGPCGRTLKAYRARVGDYLDGAQAFVDLPRGHPMSALDTLQGELLRDQETYSVAALRVRGMCRPG